MQFLLSDGYLTPPPSNVLLYYDVKVSYHLNILKGARKKTLNTEVTNLIKKMPKLVTNNTKTIRVLQSFVKQFHYEKHWHHKRNMTNGPDIVS